MNREESVKTSAAGQPDAEVLAAGKADATQSEPDDSRISTPEEERRAAVCGLFCGACSDKVAGRCHGCGCTCGKCVASGHGKHCKILKCASAKGLDSCADCPELPCTELIMHACDPLFLTSAPCIENLRRRKAIGTKKWIEEQHAYWADEDNLRKLHFAEARGQAAVRELKKSAEYKKPW